MKNRTINPDYWVEGYDDYVASISYGKDSLAMLEVIHEYGFPLTHIVTVDVMADEQTSANFEDVEAFKRHADSVILERYGLQVIHLRSEWTYDSAFHRIRQRGANEGKMWGFPMVKGNWCNKLKMQPIQKFKADAIKEGRKQFWYVGYAIDEVNPKRQEKIQNAVDVRMYPLVVAGLRERVQTDVF